MVELFESLCSNPSIIQILKERGFDEINVQYLSKYDRTVLKKKYPDINNELPKNFTKRAGISWSDYNLFNKSMGITVLGICSEDTDKNILYLQRDCGNNKYVAVPIANGDEASSIYGKLLSESNSQDTADCSCMRHNL